MLAEVWGTGYYSSPFSCLFVWIRFSRQGLFKRSSSGDKLYTSKLLESLWPYGISSVGDVTFQSAAYIARYCVAKRTGDAAKSWYACDEFVDEHGEVRNSVTPEFNRMSLKPGIGSRWLEKFKTDVYPRDYVVVNGVKVKPLSTMMFFSRGRILVLFLRLWLIVSCRWTR